MKLELGNFYVKDIVFSEKTSYSNGILKINKEEALGVVKEDEHITEADLIIVKPGDKVRLVPVKEAIEPRCRVEDGSVFPGVTGELMQAGMRLAEYIGSCVKGLEPEKIETFELEPVIKRSKKIEELPSVVLVLQPQSQMEELGYNDLIYGWDANRMVPTFMHPNEVLDGAVISGSFMPCSSKWSTYDFQNFPMIKRLYEEHGKTLNFLGVIMSNLNVALEQKERSALFVAQMARSLGADSAIVAEEGYGNPDADFIACIVALEDAGVKTVGLTNECTGRDGASQPLVTLDPKADAIVSCGNVSELIELGPMETVIGELASLGRDGLSGGWEDDEVLGPSVRKDGSIIMENNAMFCGDQVVGWSTKTMKEF